MPALKTKPDKAIDLSDIPEILTWSKAQRGKFYKPVKQSVTMRLDRDVVAWFKTQGLGYQTRINQILRDHITHQPRRQTKGKPGGAASRV